MERSIIAGADNMTATGMVDGELVKTASFNDEKKKEILVLMLSKLVLTMDQLATECSFPPHVNTDDDKVNFALVELDKPDSKIRLLFRDKLIYDCRDMKRKKYNLITQSWIHKIVGTYDSLTEGVKAAKAKLAEKNRFVV